MFIASATGAAVNQADNDIATVGVASRQDISQIGKLAAEEFLAELIMAVGLEVNILLGGVKDMLDGVRNAHEQALV